ncbi:facilitated trehalose transporter Tret1-like isoform X2 [Bradysia coprophila]|uniref:facilitated trehalose transporter Tret1-like isoform X2 n=1 Tax=Bradysia coprophila TaxID=38358 RepID=UPI00187D97FD|nr:facilitated trehalose transporter Tret1-like isoform X2 [Bradysia coprophila]
MKATYSVNNNNSVVDAKTQNRDGKATDSTEDFKEVSSFRTIFPQVLASSAKNLLLLDLGLAAAFPTIVIPALRGLQNEKNPDEFLQFSAVQASWYGSMGYICQPIGSVFSGLVSEPLGRKKAMILVNIPHIIAWTMLYFASSLEEIYIAAVLLGLGIGFMEAPIITYVGEICQPTLRGILTSCAGISVMLGFFIVFCLGSIMTWRYVAIICLIVPLITVVAICFVPETPMWLLSKDRPDDALKSLQWLRGWVPAKNVEKEFAEMKRYSVYSSSCASCQKTKSVCEHPPPTFIQKLQELTRKRNLKPFVLALLCFAFAQLFAPIRPYMVQLFTVYGIPMDVNWATSVVALLGLLANIVCTCIIKVTGKRKLWLVSMAGTLLSCLGLGTYAYNFIPSGWSSFDKHEPIVVEGHFNYIPMILFFTLAFFTSVGVTPIPWILLSEVFPFKSRGFATGITAAINYLLTFISVKTYLNFETWFTLSGIMWIYGVAGLFGLFCVYRFLPETENRTLEDIELYFTDSRRKWTDIKIVKQTSIDGNVETTDKDNRSEKGCDNKAFVQNLY